MGSGGGRRVQRFGFACRSSSIWRLARRPPFRRLRRPAPVTTRLVPAHWDEWVVFSLAFCLGLRLRTQCRFLRCTFLRFLESIRLALNGDDFATVYQTVYQRDHARSIWEHLVPLGIPVDRDQSFRFVVPAMQPKFQGHQSRMHDNSNGPGQDKLSVN